ncbi:hypothetical protein D9M68_996560 [compost metagenome]
MIGQRQTVCERRYEPGLRPVLIGQHRYIGKLRIFRLNHAYVRLQISGDAVEMGEEDFFVCHLLDASDWFWPIGAGRDIPPYIERHVWSTGGAPSVARRPTHEDSMARSCKISVIP